MLSVNIDLVGKQENAPNFPQARSIEMFWGIMRKRYSAPGKPVKNLNGFKCVYHHLDKKRTKESAQRLIRRLGKNFGEIGHEEALAIH
jgi:hypothetical protein